MEEKKQWETPALTIISAVETSEDVLGASNGGGGCIDLNGDGYCDNQ